MNELRAAVNDFCNREYGHDADFTDPKNVKLLSRNGVEVYVDLVHVRLGYYPYQDTTPVGLIVDELTREELATEIRISTADALYTSALEAERMSTFYKKDWEFYDGDDGLIEADYSTQEMREYGYKWDGMIPINKEHAIECWNNGYSVMLLYGDDTESYADSMEDIMKHDGIFGVEAN